MNYPNPRLVRFGDGTAYLVYFEPDMRGILFCGGRGSFT